MLAGGSHQGAVVLSWRVWIGMLRLDRVVNREMFGYFGVAGDRFIVQNTGHDRT
jgi:hypothetical protein